MQNLRKYSIIFNFDNASGNVKCHIRPPTCKCDHLVNFNSSLKNAKDRDIAAAIR